MTRDEVATTWRELVLKHTKGGACNFQDAAHELAEIVRRVAKAEPVQEPVNYTTGHCKNRKQKGGCQLHNLQCGWPDCDRRPTHPPQCPAEPVQEPVAWMCNNEELVRRGYSRFSRTCSGEWNIPVWTHPPRTKTNQCGETCERAKLCPACLACLTAL